MPGYLSSPGGVGPWPGVVGSQRLGWALEALGIEHDIKVYPDAGHAFLHQSADEPGLVGVLARITHAGYHEASAQDARHRIVSFFETHLTA